MAPAGQHEDGAWVFGCWHLPDTFVEDVEFVICQTFFLEDSYDGIVNAVTWNTQICVSAQSRMLKTAFSAAWQRSLRTCSRWHWPLPSSASLLCPLVNFSRSSPARWDWASSSTWADAESSWRKHEQIQRHTKYRTAEKRVRPRADVERSKRRTKLEGRRDIRDRRAREVECIKRCW